MIKEGKVTEILNVPVEDIWDLITNRENTSWRNDIASFQWINDNEFSEININGLKTIYTIVEKKEFELYELKMSNKFIDGIFKADFKEVDENKTEVTIYQKNNLLNISAIISNILFVNLQKLLNRYVYDLKQEVKRRSITKK